MLWEADLYLWSKLSKIKKELEEKKKLARENNGRIPEQYTLSEWFEIWFTTYKEPTVSEQSVGPMRSKVKVFLDRIGDKKLADISSIDIQQIINATMIETEYARKSINEASNRLKLVLTALLIMALYKEILL